MIIFSGILFGAAIACVDNLVFGGEVSPILIVLLLLCSSGLVGSIWGKRGWLAAIFVWAINPSVHILKHVFNLPDTIFPNTYLSILLLAVFTFVLAGIGVCCGIFFRRAIDRTVD